MPIEITKAGAIVARSRNLRGILSYARKSPVATVSVSSYSPVRCAHVYVQFDDGAECRTQFSSYTVAVQWVRARRSWGLEAVRCSDDLWMFHFPSYSTSRSVA